MPLTAYRELLAKRQVQVVVGSSIIAGLSVGVALPIVLLVQEETGSFASAGAVTAALAISSAVTSPWRGRMVDTHGQSRTLPWLGLGSALGLWALVATTLAGAPLAVPIFCAVIAGTLHAPMLSSTRPLWADLVDHPDQMTTAYALQAIILEVFFISGPLVAAALIVLGSPAAAVVAIAAAELLGVLALAATPASRAWRGPPRTVGAAGAMASVGMRTLISCDVPFGMMFGCLDVAVPAFCKANGAAAAAGAVLAALAVGSMIGGVVYGSRPQPVTATRFALLTALVALCTAPLAAAGTIAALAALAGLAGLFVAPTNSVGLALIDVVAPPGTAAEATSWGGAAYQGGLAVGTAFAGAVVAGAGTTTVFLAGVGFVCLSALIAWFGRRVLSRPYQPPVTG
jgi:MFS family permease